ncbi:ankyrin repeat domain-containing protein [Halobacteriovorax sp. RT-2-4]|uniref:ankyrin repeat domain-containing protein n=1 Tax=unclassified Halobacteriovorax TaxID=2639665 RepID=UPI00399C06CC
MRMISLLILLYSNLSFGKSIAVTGKPANSDLFRSVYTLENQGTSSYYCRNIYLYGIDYSSDGEFVYSLDDKIQNKLINAKSSVEVDQGLSQDLIDMVDLFPDLTVSHTNMTYSHDCEVKSVRMNNIFVLDDGSQCGTGLSLKKYVLDNGNRNLISIEEKEINFTKDSIYTKLNVVDAILVLDKGNFQVLDTKDNSVTPVSFDLADQYFISAFGISKDKFVIVSYDREGMKLNLVIKYNDKFESVKEIVTSVGTLRFNEANEKLINVEDAKYKLFKQAERISKTISVYIKEEMSFESLEILISYRFPKTRMLQTSYSLTENQFTKYKYDVSDVFSDSNIGFKKYVLDLGQEFRILKDLNISFDKVQNEISEGMYKKAAPSSRVLRYGDYNISARNDSLKLSFDQKSIEVAGTCRPQLIFSDKKYLFKNADINTLYQGKTLLTMRVRSSNYSEALKLIANGARVDEKDIRGKLPIDYAVYKRDLKMIRLLLENGATLSSSKSFNLNDQFERTFDDYEYQSQVTQKENIEYFSYLVKTALEKEYFHLSKSERRMLKDNIASITDLNKVLSGVL